MLRIGANISGLQSQMRAGAQAVGEFSKKSSAYIERNQQNLTTLSNGAAGLGVGLTALSGLAVKRFAEFDKAMSSVAATGADARGSLNALRQAAITAGADTAFSATEAAQGIENLAKAGVGAKDILGGGLRGALSLAAAGGLGVAEAAEIAATALTQFNLEGAQVPHVADLLAAGAGKAQGGVGDLSQALNQAGLIASQTGLSIEETTGALSAFASAGLLGSDAGTSFKTMLQVLAAPSSTAAAEMERLGINAYDAGGKFVGLQDLAGQLRSSLAGLTDQQRSNALATIFGADAVRAASVIYDQGALGIKSWTAAVDEQGYAAETARIQTDNLTGDLERLGGALDTVLIQSGSGANNVLRSLAQGAEGVVEAVGEIPAPVLSATGLIAGAGGLALLGVAGLGKLTVAFSEAKGAADALGISTKTAGLAAGALGAALAVGTIAMAAWADNAAEAKGRTDALKGTLDEFGATTDATVRSLNETLAAPNQVNLWETIFGAPKDNDARSAFEMAEQLQIATEDVTLAILGQADAQERVNTAIEKYQESNNVWDMEKNRAAETLPGIIDEQRIALEKVTTETERKAAADRTAGVATDELAAASEAATAAINPMTEAIEDNWKASLDASGAVLSLRDAQRQAEAAYDDAREALKDNGKTLDQSTEKGRANQAALDAIASSGFDVVDSVRATGGSLKDVQGAMSTARKRFVETAVSMGMGEKAANRLADELRLIPKNVSTIADVNTSNALAKVATLDNTLNRINGKVVTASVAIKQYGQAAMATGGRLPGFPTGGRLPGSPPADPMQDNLLGVDDAGLPRVRVRSREWVVSQPAADYYGDGIMSALNSRRISREALASLPGLASGGAIGAAERDVSRAWRDIRRWQDRYRAATRRGDERAADRAADQRDKAEERRDEAAQRRDRLRSEAVDLREQLRRGEIRDSVSSGLSGAYSSVDQLRDLASSGDVSARSRGRLNDIAGHAERSLRSLYTQADRVDNKLASARDRLQELQEVRDGVRSDIVGGFGLSDVRGEFDPKTGKRVASASALAAAAKAYAGKARKFAGLLGKLGTKGGSAAIVQEVAGYGVEQGTALAESLLADLPSLRSLSQSYQDIEKFGGWAGANVARAVGGGKGLSEAAAAVRSAEAQAKAIDKRIGAWGKRIGIELARALGIKARASGGPMDARSPYLVGEQGAELVVPQRAAYVLNADKTANLTAPRYVARYPGSNATSSAGTVTTSIDRSLTVKNYGDPVTSDTLLRFDRKRDLLEVRR